MFWDLWYYFRRQQVSIWLDLVPDKIADFIAFQSFPESFLFSSIRIVVTFSILNLRYYLISDSSISSPIIARSRFLCLLMMEISLFDQISDVFILPWNSRRSSSHCHEGGVVIRYIHKDSFESHPSVIFCEGGVNVFPRGRVQVISKTLRRIVIKVSKHTVLISPLGIFARQTM